MPATTNRKVTVHLSTEQRQDLEAILRQQTVPVATARRARVLLLADEDHRDGQRPDPFITAVVEVSPRQVARIRQRFTRAGLAPRGASGPYALGHAVQVGWGSRSPVGDARGWMAAWPEARNRAGVGADWRFTTADARIKLRHLHPVPDKNE